MSRTTYNSAAPDLIDALAGADREQPDGRAERAQLDRLFASVSQMSDVVGDFVSTNSDQIIGLSRDSIPSLQVLAQYSTEFPCVGRALADMIPRVNKAFGVGTEPGQARTSCCRSCPSRGKYVAGPGHPALQLDRRPALPVHAGDDAREHGARRKHDRSAHTTASLSATGLGPANSTTENQLINELIAPTAGLRPDQMPAWSSLMLGPLLRGATVTVK